MNNSDSDPIEVSTVDYKAGRLSTYFQEWCKITSDPVILSWIKGYRLPIKNRIKQKYIFKNKNWSKSDAKDIRDEIDHLLTIGAIKESSPCKGQFISRIFLISKSNGKKRLILNLKELNKYLITQHFKMEDRKTVTKYLTHESYLATLDLKDAYFLISVHKAHRKYLRFLFNNKISIFVNRKYI